MKREGDRIIFDSEAQKRRFENALQKRQGATVFVEHLLDTIGKAQRAADEAWTSVKDEIDLADDETLRYFFIERELRVEKL